MASAVSIWSSTSRMWSPPSAAGTRCGAAAARGAARPVRSPTGSRTVKVAPCPRPALAAAERHSRDDGLDLVVSDLGLPDGTGLDLMAELRDRYGVRGIALSGYGMEEDVLKSLAAGFERHLTKPIDLQALQAAIQDTARG